MCAWDALESWAAGEVPLAASREKALDKWLRILAERCHNAGEIEGLQAVLKDDEYPKLEAELMKLLLTYQGILPKHLPKYALQTREAKAQLDWYERLVRCCLDLLALLKRLDESKKAISTARGL